MDIFPRDEQKVLSRILVTQTDLSRIIGKSGQTVANIRAKCGAIIKGFNLEDTENKLVVIGGNMIEVLEGFDMVVEVLYEPHVQGLASGTFHLEMLIDNQRAGRILGPKGLTVTTLKSECGCSVVRLMKDPVEVCGQSLRTVLLEGNVNCVQRAHFMIQQLIYEGTPHQIAPAVGVDGSIDRAGVPNVGGGYAMYANGSFVPKTANVLNTGGPSYEHSRREPPPHSPPVHAAAPVYSSTSAPSTASGSNSARILVDFGVPLSTAAEAEKLVQELARFGVEVSFARAGSNRGGEYGGIGAKRSVGDMDSRAHSYASHRTDPYTSTAPPHQVPRHDTYGGRSDPYASRNTEPYIPRGGEGERIEFLIPVDRVGAVLGVGGRNSKEIQAEFRVFLHIEKDDSANPGYRKIMMGGNDAVTLMKAKERVLATIDAAPSGPPSRY